MDAQRPQLEPRQLPLFAAHIADRPVGGAPLSKTPATLGEAVASYVGHLVDTRRATHTVRSTALDLSGLLQQLGDRPLAEVTPPQLAAHLRWLRGERRNGNSSIRRKIATFKTFFRHAVTNGWLVVDPAQTLAYPPPKRAPLVALAPAELESVVAAAAHDPAWHALVLLLAGAGLKRDELLALEAEDLYLVRDAADSRLVVRHAADAKRIRRRTIPLTPRAHFALARLLQAPLPGGRLFSISVRGVNFVVETVGQRAGLARLKKLTPDVLRDTFAVRAMQQHIADEAARSAQGASAKELSRLRAQHDEQLLRLLGLSRYSEMAQRYRAAATGPAGRPESATPATLPTA